MANMAQAIRMALHVGEENLGVKDIFGQDVGAPLGGGPHIRQALRNTEVLLDAARWKGIPIIYTVVAYRDDRKDMGFWMLECTTEPELS